MKFSLTKTTSRRRLTWPAQLILALFLIGALITCGRNLYAFLAPDYQPKEGILIIEGWMQDADLKTALQIYHTGTYEKIATTGVQIETGAHLINWKTYAKMTTARLIELGIPPEQIITASGIEAQRDRTYVAACTLRDKLKEEGIGQQNLHLISVGSHGRRSHLLFRKAFGTDYNIGLTSLPDQSFDPNHWWKCSNGFRKVVNETIAYFYALFFFHP